TVGVMYGNGDGTFLSPVEFSVGGWPYSVAMVDLNADGATDAVIGNDDYSGVTALLNYGGAKVSLSSSLNPATTSSTILLTASVSGVHGVAVVPTGTITFKDGATVLNSVTLSNGTASLNVSNLTAGTHVISAIYSGNSAFLSGSASMVETINQAANASYNLAANPTSATIHPGQSATFTVTATPVNGFTGSISFDCGTLPSGISCQFTPTTITISGTQPASTQLVVTASKNVLNSSIPNGGPFGTMPLWASFTGILFGAVTMDGSEHKKRRAVLITLLIVGLLAGMVMLTGCATAGGNGSHQNAVAKTVQVKARAANGTTKNLNITVYVQQN